MYTCGNVAQWSSFVLEMKEEHIFKNYSAGEPSVRLYLKNLAKQVDEKVKYSHATLDIASLLVSAQQSYWTCLKQ